MVKRLPGRGKVARSDENFSMTVFLGMDVVMQTLLILQLPRIACMLC